MKYKILVVTTYDSFLKVGVNLAQRIKHSNIEIAVQYVKKNQLSERQLVESGANNYHIIDYKTIKDSDFSEYHIVIAALGNIASQRLITRLYSLNKRPLIISCFPGVIFGNTESIFSRINADILLVNNESDKAIAQSIANEYKLDTNILNYGLINIDITREKSQKNHKNLFFIDQVKIPCSKNEREYVLNKLLNLARQNPDYRIFIKSRVCKKEVTVHKNIFPYSDLLKNKKNIPANFFLFDDSIELAFSEMSACLSFSSSAALEAIYYGIPTYIIKDLGISERFHNSSFIESGLLTFFDELNEKLEFSNIPNSEWFDMQISFDRNRDEILNNIIDKLFFIKKRQNTLPTICYFTVQQNSSFYRKLRKLVNSPTTFFKDTKLIKKLRKQI